MASQWSQNGPTENGMTLIEAGERVSIELTGSITRSVSDEEVQKVADLVVAAPVLYEASRLTIEALNSEYRIPANADDDWLYDTLGSALSGAYFAARAALSSARGEQGK